MTVMMDVTDLSLKGMIQNILDRLYRLEGQTQTPGSSGSSGSYPTDPTFSTITFTSGPTLAPSVPGAATGLTLTPGALFYDIYVDVAFTAPSDYQAETTYQINYAKKVAGVYGTGGIINTTALDTRVTGLQPNTTYGFRVYAINPLGVSSAPIPSSGFTDVTTGSDSTPPATVTGLAVGAGLSSLTASWTANTEINMANGAGVYEIQVDTVNTFDSVNLIDKLSGNTVVAVTNLSPNTLYYTRVRAITSSGTPGSYSSIVSSTTSLVVGANIAASAIAAVAIAAGAVTASKTALAAIDSSSGNLVANSVTSTQIVAGTIVASDIAASTITASQIAAGTITAAQIAANTITASQIAAGTITATQIQTGTITADKLTSGTITVASGVIGSLDCSKITTGLMSAAFLTTGSLTAGAITIASGGSIIVGAPAGGSGTGIIVDSTGISLYNAGTRNINLNAVTGVVSVTGTITSSTITGGTISGTTITGADILTAAYPGMRIELSSVDESTIQFFTGDVNEFLPGRLNVLENTNALGSLQPTLNLVSPSLLSSSTDASVSLTGASHNGVTKSSLALVGHTITANNATIIVTGLISLYAGSSSSIPAGWRLCDGSAVSRTVLATLFAVIGTTYGVGDGSSTFNLPDLRGRFPVGLDGTTEFAALNTKGGSKAAHSHTLSSTGWAAIVMGASAMLMDRVTASWNATVTQTGSASATTAAQTLGAALGGSTDATQVLPPYITINYIICTEG